jgi:hypothetical protein
MQNSWAYSVGMVAATVITSKVCGGCGGAMWSSYYSYRATGSLKEAAKSGAIAYATNYAFGYVGGLQLPPVPAVLAHAAVGCASAAASGGSCGSGALAAGFGKIATINMTSTSFGGNHALRMAYVSVVGGTASVLGGGKFANGAQTAAFGYLFNELQGLRLRGIGDTYLDDQFSPRVEEWIELARAQGVDLTFNEAFRTSAYQAALANNPNAITPANAGTSLHEAGFAVDVNYSSLSNIPGGLTGNQQRQIIRDTASQAGISWGGNFTNPDPPHFYVDPGNRTQRIIDAQRQYCQLSGGC